MQEDKNEWHSLYSRLLDSFWRELLLRLCGRLPREPLNGLNLRVICLVLEKSWETSIGVSKFEKKLFLNYLIYNKMNSFILGWDLFCTFWEEIADANRKHKLELKDSLLHVTIDNLRKCFSLIISQVVFNRTCEPRILSFVYFKLLWITRKSWWM